MNALTDQVFCILGGGSAALSYIHRSINYGVKERYTERQVYNALQCGKRQGYFVYNRGVWSICGL